MRLRVSISFDSILIDITHYGVLTFPDTSIKFVILSTEALQSMESELKPISDPNQLTLEKLRTLTTNYGATLSSPFGNNHFLILCNPI